MSISLDGRGMAIVLGFAAVTVSILIAVNGTASAGAGGCPDTKTLCVYADDGFDSQVVKITKQGVSNKLAKKMNNEASSVVNNFNKRVFLYDGKDAKGDKFCVDPKAELDSLGGFNDLASSSKVTKNKEGCPHAR